MAMPRRVTARFGLSAVRGERKTVAAARARGDGAPYEAEPRGRNTVVADAEQPELQHELAG